MAISSLDQVSEFPLCWPENKQRAAHRIDARFRQSATLARAHRIIEEEMKRWHVSGFVLSMAPAFRRTTTDPAVALWFNMRGKDGSAQLRVLACDKYKLQEHNAYAIGLTLDALRMVERYGTYSLEQAIEGAKLALPAPPGSEPLNWRRILGDIPQGLDSADSLAILEKRYRLKSANAVGDETAQLNLNLAIEQAREEISP